MAISLEELALGALEGGAGPWTLAVGAGALAVALAAGSTRPLRRIAATGAVTGAVSAQRAGQLNVMCGIGGWIGGLRRGWRDLVDEARTEYEAGRRPSASAAAATPAAAQPIVLKPEDRAEPAPVEAASERRVFVVEPPPASDGVPPAGPEITGPEGAASEAAPPSGPTDEATVTESEVETQAPTTRDQRGRFVRRQPTGQPSISDTNGVRAE